MLSYVAGVDDRDLDLYRSYFADDVEVVGFGDTTVTGTENWVGFVTTALEQYAATQHMLGPVLVTIESDTAQARTNVQALHYMKVPEGATLTLWATYNSSMQKMMANGKLCAMN